MAVIQATEDDRKAFTALVDENGYGIDESEAAATDTTLEDFVSQWGDPQFQDGALSVWYDIQTRKGARRGDLMVMPVEGGSLAYFSGQS